MFQPLLDDDDDSECYEEIWAKPDAPINPPEYDTPAFPVRKYSPSDFVLLKVLGKGSFGKVKHLWTQRNCFTSTCISVKPYVPFKIMALKL